jgi:hypothetical protein
MGNITRIVSKKTDGSHNFGALMNTREEDTVMDPTAEECEVFWDYRFQ